MNYNKISSKGFQAIQVLLENGIEIITFYQSPSQHHVGIRKTAKFFREAPEDAVTIGYLNVPTADWPKEEVNST